ncbi:MAG: UDP-N-acetylmuramoyl-tripeptide--D-alanyl-D-alanine ligase [Propionibacteriaceae bacterium]|jgi:UDP-N-acetylmuramoyl-tripeptide--D-alanyl-D-alanine ligase|nr:UDP-N-acetylmuramoyl-tripeptide--D-alanyl-D-alanine ligase [Propionibacteriaceae bacterium]
MRPSPLAELARVVGASSPDDPERLIGPDVVIDSRQTTPGALFVALPGERADGHDFVAEAAAHGAGAALVAPGRLDPAAPPLPLLEVSQPLAALAQLARHIVAAQHHHLTVAGLTGSAGKTTTKDLLAQTLATAGDTVAPAGSFNNQIGLPLTAARVDDATRYLVAELGARHLGDIADLAAIVAPDIGLVLNVGWAHLGQFGSVEATAAAKGELIAALPPNGWAVLNQDDPLVAGLARLHRGPTAWFSDRGRPQAPGQLAVWADRIEADPGQSHGFTLHASGHPSAQVQLRLIGRHQVANAVAAAAVALAAGLDLADVAAALSQAEARSHWRLQLERRRDGLMVVNDAYNANPDSMRAALETAAGLRRARAVDHPQGRWTAVLGDMLELGPAAADWHRQVGQWAARAGVDRLVAVGQWAPDLAAGARQAGAGAVEVVEAATAAQAAQQLGPLGGDDLVLVKASRGVGLEAVALGLLEQPGETAETGAPC